MAKISRVLLGLAILLLTRSSISMKLPEDASEIDTHRFDPSPHNPDMPINCWNECGGVDRIVATTAASWFCNLWSGRVMYQNGDLGGGSIARYYYDGGVVYISFESSWTDGCEVNGEVTPGINNFFVDEPVCYKNMIVPIDYCNTKGTHGKSGGSFNVFCGRVMIYPVPDKCSESGWIGTHWDRIFARIEALESFTNKPDLNVTGVKYVADTRKLLETYEPVTDTENLIESSDTVETTEKLLEDDAPVTDVGKLYHAEQRRFDPDTGHNIERRQPINDPEDASPARVIRRDDDVFCYNECFGVTRLQAATAIDWFCAYHAGTELWSNLDGSFLAVTGNYTYEPVDFNPLISPDLNDQGQIWMSMGLSPEKDEGSDCAEYTDGYVVDYHECGVSLRIPIDECNTAGTGWKQGGGYDAGCLQYRFDPNPFSPCD